MALKRANHQTDDADENPYNFSIEGTGLAPEIDVQGNATSIADGDSTPSASDYTDFGQAHVAGMAVVRTFIVTNTGSSTLLLLGDPIVQLSGVHTSQFLVSAQPGMTGFMGTW